MDLKQVNEALNTYIRPQTFPLAIKLVEGEAALPPRTRRPKRDLGLQMPVCQGVGMARRYGWVVAMGAEDQLCPYGALTLGMVSAKEGFLSGEYPGPFPSPEVARLAHNSMRRLEYNPARFLVLAPLHSAAVEEPDLIVIYGNSAQVMRLVQGAVFYQGGIVKGAATGGMDCEDIVTETIQTNECHFVLPCNGDRIFGLAQDHEMAFTMPRSKIQTTLQGLEAGHKSGLQRYPIPNWFQFQGQMPPRYRELMEYLRKG